MKKHRIIIAGSRCVNENNKNLMKRIDDILSNLNKVDVCIVSGTCKGADILGENYAKQNGIEVVQFPADWKAHGKSAGYKRNKVMAEYSTHLIAIWDGKSKGTKHMIDLAKGHGLFVRILSL